MLKVNGYDEDYNQLFIYNDDGVILFKTERPYGLNLDLTIKVRNARKLCLCKHDCFEVKSSNTNTILRNGKDLYIHNSVIDVVGVEEVKCFEAYGETCYKDVYTLRLMDGSEIKVESDFYTRVEKTEDRLYRERLAQVISDCLYSGKHVSHYEVERLLEKLDITIKE